MPTVGCLGHFFLLVMHVLGIQLLKIQLLKMYSLNWFASIVLHTLYLQSVFFRNVSNRNASISKNVPLGKMFIGKMPRCHSKKMSFWDVFGKKLLRKLNSLRFVSHFFQIDQKLGKENFEAKKIFSLTH